MLGDIACQCFLFSKIKLGCLDIAGSYVCGPCTHFHVCLKRYMIISSQNIAFGQKRKFSQNSLNVSHINRWGPVVRLLSGVIVSHFIFKNKDLSCSLWAPPFQQATTVAYVNDFSLPPLQSGALGRHHGECSYNPRRDLWKLTPLSSQLLPCVSDLLGLHKSPGSFWAAAQWDSHGHGLLYDWELRSR